MCVTRRGLSTLAELILYLCSNVLQLVVLSLLAGSTSLVTIIGNMIVILSFIIERSIRQPTNYFIASLAVSDLLIGEAACVT